MSKDVFRYFNGKRYKDIGGWKLKADAEKGAVAWRSPNPATGHEYAARVVRRRSDPAYPWHLFVRKVK